MQQTKGIYKIRPGLYGLEKYKKQIEDRGILSATEKNAESEDFNCSIILTIKGFFL